MQPSPSPSPPAPPSRLVLLPNTEDAPREEYTDDDDEDDDNDDDDDPQPPIIPPVPPLSPSLVFLYLLAPYLRLGAIFVSDFGGVPLDHGLVALVVTASLSAFCRQIWFLLGRYLRTSSTEDILVHMFARRHRRVRKYALARHTFTVVRGSFRLLLAAMYLRDCVDAILFLQLPESIPLRSRFNVSALLSILLFVLSMPRSLAAKSVIYTTTLAMASFLAWLVVTSRSYGTNLLSQSNVSLPQRGVLWNEISSLAFACTTSMTIPLTTSLTASAPSPPATRNTRTRSFELLNVFSAMLGALLILPLVVMATAPRAPASIATSDHLVLGLRITTLALSIPFVVISIISPPLHGTVYRFIRTDLALSIITLAIFALSLVPPMIASILDDITLFLAVSGSFLIPALAHIAIHYFRRPLSIVMPHESPSSRSALLPSNAECPPSPSRDPLLQRKERLLQRRRLGKRLLWDIVIWIAVLPICACAFVWTAGRLAHRW